MTPLPVSIAAAIASFLLLVLVLELIRRHRLRERYALLWLGTGVVLLALSLWRGGLNTIAGWFGVQSYPPAILGAVGALFILVVLLHKHRLRLQEVPVEMRERAGGRSSITALRSVYYMTKVLLAIFVGLFRRNAVPLEEDHR